MRKAITNSEHIIETKTVLVNGKHKSTEKKEKKRKKKKDLFEIHQRENDKKEYIITTNQRDQHSS